MDPSFVDGTAVQRVAPGRYEASIGPDWNLRPLPQGGMVTALAVRSMAAELDDPSQRVRTLHTTFATQVADGRVEVDVELLRRGRSMSHLRAEVRNPGAARGHLTTAVFGSGRDGFDFTDLEPPRDVPAPAACPSFRDPPPDWFGPRPPMPFWDRIVEGRNVRGHPPWEDHEPGPAERVMWYRFDQPPMQPDGTMDPAALVVLADTMPGAVAERTADPGRMWFAPSVDLTVHLLDECRSDWVLGHNRVRWAGGGYASADMALWDAGPDGASTPSLVAYATQVFFFRFAD